MFDPLCWIDLNATHSNRPIARQASRSSSASCSSHTPLRGSPRNGTGAACHRTTRRLDQPGGDWNLCPPGEERVSPGRLAGRRARCRKRGAELHVPLLAPVTEDGRADRSSRGASSAARPWDAAEVCQRLAGSVYGKCPGLQADDPVCFDAARLLRPFTYGPPTNLVRATNYMDNASTDRPERVVWQR